MSYFGRSVFVLSLLLSLATPALAKTLTFGPRAGDEVDIVSASGLGTRHAVINVKMTRENARKKCVEYSNDHSEKCIGTNLRNTGLKDHIEGDCVSGWFTILYQGSDRFRFMGKLQHPAVAGAHYRIVYQDETLDGSTASSYGEALEQYNALCPGHVDMKLDQ